MPIPLFNRFGGGMNMPNGTNQNRNNQSNNNLLNQYLQLLKNPSGILDILMQNKKIDQQQYNDLQQYKNNPQQIANYLIQHGNANQINQAQQLAGQNK